MPQRPLPHPTPGQAADRRRLVAAFWLITAFMAAEVVTGVIAHSLALLSDAGHMLTDAGALALSLVAMRLAARPPAGGLTYGLRRAEILSGLANGVTLFVLAALIVFEAVHRLVTPPAVDARWVLGVALAGIGVNILATRQLAQADRHSLNVRGSYQHVITDLFAFAGTAIAAIVMLVTGFARADAIVSILVAVLMLRAGYGVIREAVLVLLEAAPSGMDPTEVISTLSGHPLVVDVHDFHVWEITSGMPALSAHVLVAPGEDCHAVRRELEQRLAERFDITHSTLQVDHARSGPSLTRLQPRAPRSRPEAG